MSKQLNPKEATPESTEYQRVVTEANDERSRFADTIMEYQADVTAPV